LISINILFMIMAMRWYLILKLMDTSDLIMTKELQGGKLYCCIVCSFSFFSTCSVLLILMIFFHSFFHFSWRVVAADEKDLRSAKKSQSFMRLLVPEWKAIQNLWAKKAWQTTIRHQIMANRSLHAMNAFKLPTSGNAGNASGDKNAVVARLQRHNTQHFKTSTQRKQADKALRSLGLGAREEAKEREVTKREKKEAKQRRSEKMRQRKNSFKSMFAAPLAGTKKNKKNKLPEGLTAMEVIADAEKAREKEKKQKGIREKSNHEKEIQRKSSEKESHHQQDLEKARHLLEEEDNMKRKEKKDAGKEGERALSRTPGTTGTLTRKKSIRSKEKTEEVVM
jgi:hypothetical protein